MVSKHRLLIGAALALALSAVCGAAYVCIRAARHSSLDRTSLAEVEDRRRANGDVVVLSYTSPFENVERIRTRVAATPGVERAGVFAIWQVVLRSATAERPGLLKLETLDRGLARQLGLVTEPVPAPRRSGRDPELAVGAGLARELNVIAGDALTIRVERSAGTTGEATVRCRVVSVVRWGYPKADGQLLYADLSHRTDFRLLPTGIELLLGSPGWRNEVAQNLRELLGSGFKVATLEELTGVSLPPEFQIRVGKSATATTATVRIPPAELPPVSSVWSLYRSTAGGFEAYMPKDTREAVADVELAGRGHLTQHVASGFGGTPEQPLLCAVAYMDYPTGSTTTPREALQMLSSMMPGRDKRVLPGSVREFTLFGHAAKDLTFVDPTNAIQRVRYLATAHRFYHLMLGPTRGTEMPAEAEKFFGSFRLLDEPP